MTSQGSVGGVRFGGQAVEQLSQQAHQRAHLGGAQGRLPMLVKGKNSTQTFALCVPACSRQHSELRTAVKRVGAQFDEPRLGHGDQKFMHRLASHLRS